MSDQFFGEIRAFAFNFAPRDWAYCYGQKVSVQQYQALYAIIGSHFGPTDHQTYFTLPDLTGRAVMHTNTGAPGLSTYTLAQTSGTVSVAISNAQMPNHTHQASAPQVGGLQVNTPTALAYPSIPRIVAGNTTTTYDAWTTGTPKTYLNSNALAPVGGSPVGSASPHTNTSPYLALNFCIALDGIFPVRN